MIIFICELANYECIFKLSRVTFACHNDNKFSSKSKTLNTLWLFHVVYAHVVCWFNAISPRNSFTHLHTRRRLCLLFHCSFLLLLLLLFTSTMQVPVFAIWLQLLCDYKSFGFLFLSLDKFVTFTIYSVWLFVFGCGSTRMRFALFWNFQTKLKWLNKYGEFVYGTADSLHRATRYTLYYFGLYSIKMNQLCMNTNWRGII